LPHFVDSRRTSLDVRGQSQQGKLYSITSSAIATTAADSRRLPPREEGRFGKQDFRYVAAEDIYICPAGEKLAHLERLGRPSTIAYRKRNQLSDPCD